MNKRNKGITLIALAVTIIVMLILAGVTIATLTGENGIITQAKQATITKELSEYKEQIELFTANLRMENSEFDEESLFAGRESLRYNTKDENEEGTIKTICPQIKDSWISKLEIKKGRAIIDTKDKTEIRIARNLGIEVNPYEITEEGELVSSEGNLLLVDTSGTLTLPDSVKIIGEGTFANTASDGITLKKVIIPSTVTEIKANAFNGNTEIEEIEIQTKNGKGVTKIGDYAFANCSKLKSMIIPNTVTEIGRDAFYLCKSLSDIKLSNKITKISYQMFYYCTSLPNVEIPEGVTDIEAGAFSNCTNLKKLVFPSTLNYIAANVFSKELETIEVKNGANFIFENGILMNQAKTKMYYVNAQSSSSEIFNVPDGITELQPGVLRSGYKIKKIIIPSSVTSIENSFFPSNVENIEIDNNNPQFIVINGGIYSKDNKTLYLYFAKDNQITIEEGVTTIGQKALIRVKAKTINLPQSVKKIEQYAVWNNGYVKKVIIGENVNSINPTAFQSSNIDVEINKNNNYYFAENGIIYNKDKTKIIICTKNLENIEIPSGVKEIERYAFSSRTSLKNIIFPNTIEKIGNLSFDSCTNLTQIEIPSSVTSIGTNCFRNTNNLKKIIINKEKGSISGAPWGNMYGDRAIEWKNN